MRPALRRGDDHGDIRRQLGHAPRSTQLYTTYGVYLTQPKRRQPADSVTTPGTTPSDVTRGSHA